MSNFVLLEGDCVDKLKEIPDSSIDSLITDPPAGIAFMGKDWDKDKGGSKEWIAWMSSIMKEALRVLKPGAHGLVWAIPRTSHWTATALEDAGFEIRDVVTHLFGTGFPKSLDISKAIDKAAGADREVVGSHTKSGAIKGGKMHAGSNEVGVLTEILHTAPSTDAAKQWQGWGTALKPASEHWILVRKPCSEKTVAANVLKYGTGALNIDASRISTTDGEDRSRPPRTPNSILGGGKGTNLTSSPHSHQGRFPANLVLSHNEDCGDTCTEGCSVAILDEQSGTSKSTGGGMKDFNNSSLFQGETSNNKTDSCGFGGASRFFKCFARATNESCQSQKDSQNAVTVEVNSKSIKIQIVSVLEAALKKAGQEDKPLRDSTQHFIQETLKQLNLNEEIDLQTIQNIASKYWQELRLIEKFHKNHASYAEILKLTDIMRIIPSLSMSTSIVENATLPIMPNNSELGEKDLNGNRFIYCAKASKSEKNAGCEDFEAKSVSDGPTVAADNAFQRGKTERLNTHPTVKSTKLMSYLITPPNGVVLDPFTGSGSTGVAALGDGFMFIGIEREEEYCTIARARLEHASKDISDEIA